MADLKLTNGDLDITAHKASLVSGEEAIEQGIRIRLQTFTGEDFLDTTIGIPMWTHVLIKGANLSIVKSIFRQAVRKTPGVDEVLDMQLQLNPTTRTLELDFQARMDTGEILRPSEPFLIKV